MWAGCGKPAFFTVKNPLFEILPESGLLRNTDGGTPMIPIGEADMPSDLPPLPSGDPTALPGGPGQPAGVFQGGSTTDLHKLLGVQAGAQACASAPQACPDPAKRTGLGMMGFLTVWGMSKLQPALVRESLQQMCLSSTRGGWEAAVPLRGPPALLCSMEDAQVCPSVLK